MSKLTFVDLQELAGELTKRFGIIWRPKSGAIEMEIAGAILDAAKIMEAARFKAFSTTVAIPGVGIVCWLGFDLADATMTEETVMAYVSTLTHEADHAWRMTQQGAVPFDLWYVADKDKRCVEEAHGYAAGACVQIWRGREPATPVEVGAKLQSGYGVGAEARVTAERGYASLVETAKAGGVFSPVVAFVLGWLDQRAPHLRG